VAARRTKARERALQALYQIDVAAEGIDDALARFWKSFEPVEAEVMDLAEAFVRGWPRTGASSTT
jgi:N utilization substance protein B